MINDVRIFLFIFWRTILTTIINTTLGMDGVEGGHFVVISIAADLSVPDSSNAFRHSVSDSVQHSISAIHADAVLMLCRL